MRISDWSSDVCSSDLGFEELAGLALGIEPAVLVGLGAGEGGDALHEVVDALGRTAFLAEHGCDDLGGLGLGKAPLAQEILAIRSEEHTSELQSLMRSSYAVFCFKKTTISS